MERLTYKGNLGNALIVVDRTLGPDEPLVISQRAFDLIMEMALKTPPNFRDPPTTTISIEDVERQMAVLRKRVVP